MTIAYQGGGELRAWNVIIQQIHRLVWLMERGLCYPYGVHRTIEEQLLLDHTRPELFFTHLNFEGVCRWVVIRGVE